MINEMWSLFLQRKEFFFELLAEHLKISAVAILIAIVFGGLVGILISEYQKSAKSTLGVINFLYKTSSCNAGNYDRY